MQSHNTFKITSEMEAGYNSLFTLFILIQMLNTEEKKNISV